MTMQRAAGFLRRQAEEIAADPALRAYGAVLALLHVLAAYWIRQRCSRRASAPRCPC